ncbi:SRPBCC family protein [Agaribacterium haliotis]|uniref:SRPBCC family protein n=1 Tax=Agaribacterium haliotis TaxID=2013869 RepID=UPI0013047632|nr:SRPBCC family protein [Agaribacterium haliotis]
MSAQRFEVSAMTKINADRATVWQALEEFDDVYRWAPGVSESYAIGEEKLGIGHGRHCKIDGFGGIDEYITEWNPGQSLSYSVTPVGPLHRSNSQWRLTDAGAGSTQLTICLNYELRFGVFGKMMHKLMVRKKLESALPSTLQALKTRIEQQTQLQAEPLVAAS